MATEIKDPAHPRLARIVRAVLPRALRDSYFRDLMSCGNTSTSEFLRESAVLIFNAYKMQLAGAFDKAASAAEILAVIFCVGASSGPFAVVILLGATIGALSLRDAYMHTRVGAAQKKTPGDPPVPDPSYLDRLYDTAVAAVFLFFAQSAMQGTSPGTAVPASAFSRSAWILLPLMATLRCVLRPTRAPKPSFDGDEMTAEELSRRIWRLNCLWFVGCLGVMYIGPHPFEKYGPITNALSGAIPPVTFGVWKNIQRNRISKKIEVQEIFPAKKKALERLRDGLLKGLKEGDSLYIKYLILEVLFFLEMAAPLAFQISPWLAGRGDIDLFLAGFNLVMFATVLLTWNQVKATNRAAAAAIELAVNNVK